MSNIKFCENCPNECRVGWFMWPDSQTEGHRDMMKSEVAFPNFAKELKKCNTAMWKLFVISIVEDRCTLMSIFSIPIDRETSCKYIAKLVSDLMNVWRVALAKTFLY